MNVKKPDVRVGAKGTFNIEAVSIALTPSWRHVEKVKRYYGGHSSFSISFFSEGIDGLFRPHVLW